MDWDYDIFLQRSKFNIFMNHINALLHKKFELMFMTITDWCLVARFNTYIKFGTLKHSTKSYCKVAVTEKLMSRRINNLLCVIMLPVVRDEMNKHYLLRLRSIFINMGMKW